MSGAAGARTVDVGIVIPTLGGPLLDDCLDSIARGTVHPAAVIVVDQGTVASTRQAVESLRARGLAALHLPAARRGISAATNLGLARVKATYAAVTHDDCRVHPDWLERLHARLQTEGEVIVTGRVEPVGDGIVLTVKTSLDPARYTRPLIDGDVLFPPNMGFAVRLIERVGRFDEHPSLATAGEDNEWAHRALRAGVAIVYEPTAAVGHVARHTAADLPGLYRRYARGQGAFYGTWLRRGDWFIALRTARDLVRAPWLLARGLTTRNSTLTSMAVGELTGLLPGIVAGLGNPGQPGGTWRPPKSPPSGS